MLGIYVKNDRKGESRSLLVFWHGESTSMDSQVTVSMEGNPRISTTSLQTLAQERNRELMTTAQQTDITCSNTTADLNGSVTDVVEEQTAHVADPPLRNSNPNGQSILGSVRALLLQKPIQVQSQESEKGIATCSSVRVSDTICRICFGGESSEQLVRPCSCRGTVAAVHRSCLERWLMQAATSYCELCRYHYRVTRTHKWSFLRSIAEWARSGCGAALVSDVWRGAALGAASALCTSRALHACDHLLRVGTRGGGYRALAANVMSSLLIGLTGALNGLLTTWMLLKIQEHQLSWQNWRNSTLHVHVTIITQDGAIALDVQGVSENTLEPIPSDATVVADVGSLDEDDPSLISLPYE